MALAEYDKKGRELMKDRISADYALYEEYILIEELKQLIEKLKKKIEEQRDMVKWFKENK